MQNLLFSITQAAWERGLSVFRCVLLCCTAVQTISLPVPLTIQMAVKNRIHCCYYCCKKKKISGSDVLGFEQSHKVFTTKELATGNQKKTKNIDFCWRRLEPNFLSELRPWDPHHNASLTYTAATEPIESRGSYPKENKNKHKAKFFRTG